MYNSCKMIFPHGDDVLCGDYSVEKFKECLSCVYFRTFYENYRCTNEDGRACLMGYGPNRFTPNCHGSGIMIRDGD